MTADSIVPTLTVLIAMDGLPSEELVRPFVAWLILVGTLCLLAWVPFAPAILPGQPQRFRFQGLFACGALTRFAYDSRGHLRYLALTAELREETWGVAPGTAGEDGPSSPVSVAVHFVEYAESGEETRTVMGYSEGSGGRCESSAVEIRLPLDLFETTYIGCARDVRESFLGSAQIAVRLHAAGPLQYGPCQLTWHTPLSVWQLDSTGSRQAICSIDAEIDGKSLPAWEQTLVTGLWLRGAGWFERQFRSAG